MNEPEFDNDNESSVSLQEPEATEPEPFKYVFETVPPKATPSIEDNQPSPEEEAKALEEKAYKSGWRPKSEYTGRQGDWVDAKTFVERGPEFRYVQKTKRELEQQIDALKEAQKGIKDVVTKAEQKAYQQAIKDLEAQKNTAKYRNDFQAYEQAVQREAQIRTEYKDLPLQDQVSTPGGLQQKQQEILNSEEFKAFSTTNPWVNDATPRGAAIKSFAALACTEYATKNITASTKDQLDYVHDLVRKEFPHYFENEREEEVKEKSPKMNIPSSLPNKVNLESPPLGMGYNYTSNEVEFAKETESLDPSIKMMAEHMFRNKQDWRSYVKAFAPKSSNRRGK